MFWLLFWVIIYELIYPFQTTFFDFLLQGTNKFPLMCSFPNLHLKKKCTKSIAVKVIPYQINRKSKIKRSSHFELISVKSLLIYSNRINERERGRDHIKSRKTKIEKKKEDNLFQKEIIRSKVSILLLRKMKKKIPSRNEELLLMFISNKNYKKID